ncbi:MAG: hypothetical protein SGPRY_014996, partial [Prymnesium sp.]
MPAALLARMPQRAPATPHGYAKLRAIGKGSFGSVFLARSPQGDEVVVKEIPIKGLTPKEREATMNEVRVLKKLKHPHVISYKDSFCSADTLCICMEHAAGGDLASRIAANRAKGNRFSEAEVVRITYQLVSALAYCHHELKLLHRDLKPQNILLSSSGDVKVGDFGLSKALAASVALANTQCGTPLYMSPELCEGKPYDRGADVWALGCVIWEMMSLEAPHHAQLKHGAPGEMSKLLRHISQSSLDISRLAAHYSRDLCSLLSALLAKPASRRPSMRDILETPLMRSAAPDNAKELPPSTPSGQSDAGNDRSSHVSPRVRSLTGRPSAHLRGHENGQGEQVCMHGPHHHRRCSMTPVQESPAKADCRQGHKPSIFAKKVPGPGEARD